MGARKKATRKPVRKKTGAARKRLTPSKVKRGIEARAVGLDLGAPAVASLVRTIEGLGGFAVGAYREPLGGRPLLIAVVPVSAVEPTPFQRDLSPTHTKRLAEKIEEAGSFLDPLICVLAPDGRLWTPNGRHRLASAKLLGLQSITVLVSADPALAYRILALNTEKAHNLKDRSLEVIRMARALIEHAPRSKEGDYAEELESGALLTLGIAYESNKRFPGSAYHPLLRRIDGFRNVTLKRGVTEREGWAARLTEIDARVREIVSALQARGFRSPYLRSYVVARINPVRPAGRGRAAKPPTLSVPAALTKMSAAARRFDVETVRDRDLTLVAAVAEPSDD